MPEIPKRLVDLYQHWSKHADISKNIKRRNVQNIDKETLEKMLSLVSERMRIWEAKELGKKPPYSTDPILNKFRFCNVYRELDRQTIAIHQACNHLKFDFPLWLLNIAFSRFVCRTATLEKIGELSFSIPKNRTVENKLRDLISPKYGNAYVFPVSILKKIGSADRENFFCNYLPKFIPKVAKLIETFDDDSVSDVLPQVVRVFGANFNFHWTEILIDVAYQYPQYINLYKKFPIGPGSKPTMGSLDNTLKVEEVCLSLVNLNYQTENLLTLNDQSILLSAENWEGIGCEYRKYHNLGAGTGRRRYYKNNLSS
jgi:hypothetical protein